MKYRSDIQGIRCIAVMLVIFFHSQMRWFKGGYVGVDVFFVISGYLITLGLLQSTEISLGKFYARRVRRLFPALFTTIAVTLGSSFFVMGSMDFAKTAKSAIYAIASMSNLGFWLETGYWDSDAHIKPILHTWSLSVEEQFYLFWPLVIILLRKFNQKNRIITMSSLIVIVMLGAQFFISYDSSAVFYLTPFRIYQFSMGALLAEILNGNGYERRIKSGFINEIVIVLGLGMILIPAVLYDGSPKYLGALAAIPCIGVIFLVSAGKSQIAGRLIDNTVFEYIGRTSYSLYLVHWPIFSLYGYYTLKDFGLIDQVKLITATFILGIALYYLVEQKFRRPGRAKGKKGFGGAEFSLAMSLCATFLIVIAAHGWVNGKSVIKQNDKISSIENIVERTLEEENLSRYQLLSDRCYKNRTSCFESNPNTDNILILGDSHGIDGYNIISQLYSDAHIVLGATDGCDAFINSESLYSSDEKKRKCLSDSELLFNDLQLFESLDLVVFNEYFDSKNIPLLGETIDYIRSVSNADILVFGTSPIYKNPLPLIVKKEKITSKSPQVPSEYVHSEFWKNIDSLESMALSKNVIYVDKTDFFCPDKQCLAFIDGESNILNTYDKHHLSFEATVKYGNYLMSSSLESRLRLGKFHPVDNFTPETTASSNILFDSTNPKDWDIINGNGTNSSSGPIFNLEKDGQALAYNSRKTVKAGEKFTGKVLIEIEEKSQLQFRIARYCGSGEIEQTVKDYSLTPGEHELEVNHIFEYDQGCARLTISAKDTPLSYTLKSVLLEKSS